MIDTLLLDRDGTLLHEFRTPVLTVARVRIMHATARALAGLPQRMLCLSNQSAIGRGWTTAKAIDAMNAYVAERYVRLGVRIEAFLVCPHAPWDGCTCRKPLPGLFERAAAEYEVDLSRALMVGNRLLDAEAALAAGCAGTLLLTNRALTAELAGTALPPRTTLADAATLRSVLRARLSA